MFFFQLVGIVAVSITAFSFIVVMVMICIEFLRENFKKSKEIKPIELFEFIGGPDDGSLREYTLPSVFLRHELETKSKKLTRYHQYDFDEKHYIYIGCIQQEFVRNDPQLNGD